MLVSTVKESRRQ